jgi:hypothetical protein
MPTRLYPNPDAEGRVGIPRKDGELFEAEDAERLIGQGIAIRKHKTRRKAKAAPQPAEEER